MNATKIKQRKEKREKMVNTRLRGKQKSKPRIWEASVIEKKTQYMEELRQTNGWL